MSISLSKSLRQQDNRKAVVEHNNWHKFSKLIVHIAELHVTLQHHSKSAIGTVTFCRWNSCLYWKCEICLDSTVSCEGLPRQTKKKVCLKPLWACCSDHLNLELQRPNLDPHNSSLLIYYHRSTYQAWLHSKVNCENSSFALRRFSEVTYVHVCTLSIFFFFQPYVKVHMQCRITDGCCSLIFGPGFTATCVTPFLYDWDILLEMTDMNVQNTVRVICIIPYVGE